MFSILGPTRSLHGNMNMNGALLFSDLQLFKKVIYIFIYIKIFIDTHSVTGLQEISKFHLQEMKQALRDLSTGDLNNIPADYRQGL